MMNGEHVCPLKGKAARAYNSTVASMHHCLQQSMPGGIAGVMSTCHAQVELVSADDSVAMASILQILMACLHVSSEVE